MLQLNLSPKGREKQSLLDIILLSPFGRDPEYSGERVTKSVIAMALFLTALVLSKAKGNAVCAARATFYKTYQLKNANILDFAPSLAFFEFRIKE